MFFKILFKQRSFYKKDTGPKITSVKLDVEQSLLQVCQVGGVYAAGPWCFTSGVSALATVNCFSLIKKTSVTGSVRMPPENYARPS